MGDTSSEAFDDSFVNEISKDINMEADDGLTSKLLDMENSVEDDGIDSHIQNAAHASKTSNSTNHDELDSVEPRQTLTDDEKAELDVRSIYVGNVDYGSTARDLEQHFKGCGAINRITILTDKYTGHPKGFAYVEFAQPDSVDMAQLLDDSEFRQRRIKVMPKRTNIVGVSTTNRPPRRRGSGMQRGGRMGSLHHRGGGGGMGAVGMYGGGGGRGKFPRRAMYRYMPY